MNTLLLALLIIIVIVGYPFYANIVEIFRATAWVNVLKKELKELNSFIKPEKKSEDGKTQ